MKIVNLPDGTTVYEFEPQDRYARRHFERTVTHYDRESFLRVIFDILDEREALAAELWRETKAFIRATFPEAANAADFHYDAMTGRFKPVDAETTE